MTPRRDLITFKPNRRAIQKMAHNREIRAVAADRAELVADAAVRIAPADTGAYRDGIKARVVKTTDGFVGQVVATHFTSVWLEYGTVHMRARAPLRRALEAVFGNQMGENRI
jgi:hypothetical protein